MSNDESPKPLATTEPQGPSELFATHCEAELKRRRNSGEPFDEETFLEAVDLVMRKLRSLEEEGWA